MNYDNDIFIPKIWHVYRLLYQFNDKFARFTWLVFHIFVIFYLSGCALEMQLSEGRVRVKPHIGPHQLT